jgi:hypothetical protein
LDKLILNGVTVRNWQKAAIITLVSLAIGGIYLFSVFWNRRNPGVVPNKNSAQHQNVDDLAVVRMMFMTSFDDALKLQGTSVWMKNGYTMPYYPYQGGHIVFAKRIGVVPSAQRLDIKKIIKAVPPTQLDDGISHGSRQVFAIFTLPGSPSLYATAIGALDASQDAYFCDVLFFYDDPHTIYDNWPKNVWAAIDAHQVLPGMSELQTRMSIGQKTQSNGAAEGNRTVTYDQAGKQWTVTFVNDHATAIRTP